VIRINLMPLEERGQKVRRVKKSKGGGSGRGPMDLLLPLAIVAGVLVAIVGTIVQQQAQIHMLAAGCRGWRRSRATWPRRSPWSSGCRASVPTSTCACP
jgi:hypothetical protein